MANKPTWPTLTAQINLKQPNSSQADVLVDVSDRMTDWDTRRGTTDELADVQTGTMNWKLRNTDARFDPANPQSDLFPNLLPNRGGSVKATWLGVTYPIFSGFEDQGWPISYDKNGRYGWCTPTFQDAFGPLAQIELTDAMTAEMLLDAPAALFPFSEPSGSQAFNASGVRQPPMQFILANGSTVSFGAPVPYSANPDRLTGLAFSVAPRVVTPFGGMSSGLIQGGIALAGMTGAPASGVTVACWMTLPAVLSLTYLVFVSGGGNSFTVQVTPGGLLQAADGQVAVTGPPVCDGQPHHVAATMTPGRLITLYLDGQPIGTVTSTASPTVFNNLITQLFNSTGAAITGTIADVAVYPLALSAARIAAHYATGQRAGRNDRVSDRVTRILNYAGWQAAMRNITGGDDADNVTVLQGLQSLTGTKALQNLLDAARSALADFDVDAAGRPRYRSRNYRLTQTAPAFTFGEFETVGIKDDVQFQTDPQYIASIVAITQANGPTVRRANASSVQDTFGRTLQRNVLLQDLGMTGDQADALLRMYKDGRQRVKQFTVDCAAQPGAWPTVLGTDRGMRVRVNKRTPYTTPLGITGQTTKTSDVFIESIAHKGTDSSWTVTFQTSPVPAQQAWILGDPVFGVLGSTAVPVF